MPLFTVPLAHSWQGECITYVVAPFSQEESAATLTTCRFPIYVDYNITTCTHSLHCSHWHIKMCSNNKRHNKEESNVRKEQRK